MAIKKYSENKPEINLSGPEGNAFVLLGYAKRYCKELGLSWKEVQKEMTSRDYENLIKVFDNRFGEYVDLVR